MAKQVIYTTALMKPIAHFSHAARIGDLVHVGATAGTDANLRLAGTSPGRVDCSAQTARMLDNLETVLDLAGAKLADVVRVKTYITDVRDIPAYREVYRQRLGALAPNHVIVGAHGFPLPQAAIELDAVAVIGAKAQRIEPEAPQAHPAVMIGDTLYATALPTGGAAGAAIDAAAQTREAIAALAAALDRAGLRLADVCSVHATLADIRHQAAFEAVYREAFAAPCPARTIVAAPLEHPGHAVQLEAVAVRGGEPIGAPDATLGAASPAVRAGDVLYISGQSGVSGDGSFPAGCEAQMRAAWRKINALVTAAGFPADSIVRTNSVLVDWRDYAGFNAGYGANVRAPYPPRATVLGSLAWPAARVQTEAISHRGGADATIIQVPGVP
ncbi:MAG: Rid family hydrolase [Hyphomicrobiaceae bacterium]